MAKRRRRILGGWGGLCSTFIAKMAGVSNATIRRALKKYGRAKNNTLNHEIIGFLVQDFRNKKQLTGLRKEYEKLKSDL